MANAIIAQKIKHIEILLKELEQLLSVSFQDFKKDFKAIRAAERSFQLIVDLASDINAQILIEKTNQAPDTYKQSFSRIAQINVIDNNLAEQLIKSAGIRNILVHEYDFEEDYKKFYYSAKIIIPAYHKYLKQIYKHVFKK